MGFLVDMCAELLALPKAEQHYVALDAELEHLFSSWFDVALLELRSLNWDSPASLLEKLIKYEAVHDIRSWADLKNRLDSDRRCYGFFHPRMPNVPLIFVEVALLDKMAAAWRRCWTRPQRLPIWPRPIPPSSTPSATPRPDSRA
jgi:malonyl-CoA decarboxylase